MTNFYDKVPKHTLYNLSFSWDTGGLNPWQIVVTGKNITQTQYVTELENTAGSYRVQTNAPRQWEITFKKLW